MDIFKRHTKVKHIRVFENNVLELIKYDLPEVYEVSKFIDLEKIYTRFNNGVPSGITLLHSFKNSEVYQTYLQKQNSHFFIDGITIWNRKTSVYQQIRLHCSKDIIHGFNIENPNRFHRSFDLNRLKKESIKIENLPIGLNPDKKIVEKILNSLSQKQIELLELEYTFEIDYEGKLFYTILDLEDGNYIAVDKKGKVYRLNHDHEKMVKLIASTPIDFFKIYKGNKHKLDQLFFE